MVATCSVQSGNTEHEGAAQKYKIRAAGHRSGDVEAGSDTPVYQERHIRSDGAPHLAQDLSCSGRCIELPPAVVRNDNGVGSYLLAGLCITRLEYALDDKLSQPPIADTFESFDRDVTLNHSGENLAKLGQT